MCQETNRFAAAARLTAEALEIDPTLGDDLRAEPSSPRRNPRPPWLVSVRAWTTHAQTTPPGSGSAPRPATGSVPTLLCARKNSTPATPWTAPSSRTSFSTGRTAQELVGFRDAAALAKLPADEQKEWQALWARAAELESRAEDIQQRLRAESALVPMPESRTAVPTSKYNVDRVADRDTLTIGDEAPAISVSQWVKGDPVDRLDPNKTYVVEFWATWCGPCRVSIPHLTELQKKYKDKGVTIIGVSVWSRIRDAVAPFVEQMGDKMDYTVAIDDSPRG